MQLTYAHCTKYTDGKPDRFPFSEYVFKTVDVIMYRHSADKFLGETEDTFSIELDGIPVGWGDSKDDCVHDVRYRLMDRSREQERIKNVDSRERLPMEDRIPSPDIEDDATETKQATT